MNSRQRRDMKRAQAHGMSMGDRLHAMRFHIVRTTKHYQVTETKTVDRYNGIETCDVKRTITKRPF